MALDSDSKQFIDNEGICFIRMDDKTANKNIFSLGYLILTVGQDSSAYQALESRW